MKKKCIECWDEFEKNALNKVLWNLCSYKCRNKKYYKNIDRNINHNLNTIFSDNKEKYIDKIIDYNLSTTWKWYIWLAKSPLIPNDNWIWFKWVLMQSENRSLVQCSECWKWYKIIPSNHLKSHWLTRDKYKEKFWLNKNTGSSFRYIF